MDVINTTLQIKALLQSALHSLDELSESVAYKREYKMRIENFYSWIEKQVESTTDLFDDTQSQEWVDFVTQLDKLKKQFELDENTPTN